MSDVGTKIYNIICKSTYGIWLVIFILGGPLFLNIFSRTTFLSSKTGAMGFAIYLALIVAFTAGLYFFGRSAKIKFPKFAFWFVLALGIALRLIAIYKINVPVISDFEIYFEQAKALANGTVLYNDYVAMFPHTIGYPAILSVVFRIFGASILCAQVFNIFCFVVTAAALYFAVKNLISVRVALISILIFSIWPSQIIFAAFVATEAVYTMFFMVAFLIMSLIIKSKKKISNSKFIIGVVAVGIIAAITNQIRPTAVVLIIASIIMIFLLKWINGEKISIKNFVIRSVAIVLMITVFFATGILLRSGISKLVGMDVAANSGGYTLYVGANTDNFGLWNEDDAVAIGDMRTSGKYTPTELNDKLTEMGIKRIFADPFAIVKNMIIKNGIMWSTDSYAMTWQEKSNEITDDSGTYTINTFLSDIEEAFYFAAMLFALYGVIRKLKQKSYVGDKSLFVYIIILGYAAAFILAEASNRYHYPTLPFLAVAAAIGLSQLRRGNRLQ
jgi:hypothetical protein